MSNGKYHKTTFVIAGAFLLTFVLATAYQGRASSAPNQSGADRPAVEKLDGQTETVPFAGIGEKTPEEIEQALSGKGAEERFEIAQKLENERLWSDAAAVYLNVVHMENDERYGYSFRDHSLIAYANSEKQMGAYEKLEETLEGLLVEYKDDWRVMTSVVYAMLRLPSEGVMISGKISYTPTPGAELLSLAERQRVRRLQILRDALPFVRAELQEAQKGARDANLDYHAGFFYRACIMDLSVPYWQRQELTDVDVLPEPQPRSFDWNRNRNQGAPADENGNPIFYMFPASLEEAANDGERVQALRAEEFEYVPSERGNVLVERAREAQSLFGVGTLASYRYFSDDSTQKDIQAGVWSLNTLKDSETIAKIASGVKRFELPEEYDYIALWRSARDFGYNSNQWISVAQEYEKRRQLDKAADEWRSFISVLEEKIYSEQIKSVYQSDLEQAQSALSQIVDPRVSFDAGASQVLGKRADIALRVRNANGAKMTIRKLKVENLLNQLADEKLYEDGRYFNVQNRLMELIEADGRLANATTDDDKERLKWIKPPKGGFLGEEVASLAIPLKPADHHYDSVQKIDLPDLAPGAYLLEVVADGAPEASNDAIVVWTCDAAIVRRPVDEGMRYFIVDSESGAPCAEAPVEFTIVTRTYVDGKYNAAVKTEKRATDADGSIVTPHVNQPAGDVQALTVVKTLSSDGSEIYSFLDFNPIWYYQGYRNAFAQTRAFFVSDRPIYRPEQKAEFKFIVGDARYDAPEDVNSWSGKTVAYQISSPTGEILVRKSDVKLDEYGTFSDSFEIPSDAQLGVYYVSLGTEFDANDNLVNYLGNGSFRLEEYRKPEFKVAVDAPKDPIALGDSFKATVKADYYFGAPVANAKVTYKVTRNTYRSNWFPPRYWDWFYGPGYWQFAYEAPWYPGWIIWGCRRVVPGPGYNSGVPELVSQGEGTLDEEGKFEIEIDSSLAKELFPSDDQKYDIEAEVVDESRRVIVGNGTVYAAREPFTTTVWFDRGYYKTGDKATASFQARRIDGKTVEGDAVVKLYKVTYEPNDNNEIKPIETEVFTEELKTDENGFGQVEMTVAAPGQYRVSCVVTSSNGIAEEGGQLVMVKGVSDPNTTEKKEYHFGSLEIIPDKPEYAPGETARIQISSDYPDARVTLFTRAEYGVVDDKPIYLNLENGLGYVDLEIQPGDQPNVFVEALTVFDGRFYSEQKEIAVPPQKRVLDVAVMPEKERVKPGEKTKITLRLTDPDGKPVVGQTVATVYDESLEAISGGSNVGDIREFFWKWRRYNSLSYVCNLQQSAWFNAWNAYFSFERDERLRNIGLIDPMTSYGGFYGGVNEVYSYNLSYYARPMGRAMGGMSGMMGGMGGGARSASLAVGMDAVVEAAAAPMVAQSSLAKSRAFTDDFANGVRDMPLKGEREEAPAESQESESFAEPTIRKNLADLAYWCADLQPDDDGMIEIEIDMPENLTTWKIAAWSVGKGLRVGSGEATVVTTKDVIVRMEKPRFLTRGDEAVLSAIVHNYSDEEKKVQVGLEFPEAGDNPTIEFKDGESPYVDVVVPVEGQRRVDWTVKATAVGKTPVLMKALAQGESDAIQDDLVVNEHGIDRQLAYSGLIPPVEEAENDATQPARETSFTFNVPEARRVDSAQLVVRFSPTLAGAILDAIPYLTEYPYGCTEQTLNRFLPAVLAQKALLDLGLDLETIANSRANLNAQEIGDPEKRAQQWQRVTRKDPIFDTAETRRLVEEGVSKLLSMQNDDGGWGWFYGYGSYSTPRLTALITRGLYVAQSCDYEVDQAALERGRQWLINYEREETLKVIRGMVWSDEEKSVRSAAGKWKNRADDTDAFVYYALAETGLNPVAFQKDFVDYDAADFGESAKGDPSAVHAVMKELLWRAHTDLELYALATYGLALTREEAMDENAKARFETILRAFKEYRTVDEENQTVWLDLNKRRYWAWWSWFGSEFETQGYYLRLLNRADRAILTELGLENDAPMLVKYLLNNRKNATYWNSTRDTATCLEAFAEYLISTNELNANQKVSIKIDGVEVMKVEYTPETLFTTDGAYNAPLELIDTGEHTITWSVEGDGPLYCNAYYEYFTLEDPIEKAGLEVRATRNYYRLTQKEDATTLVEGGHGQAVRQQVDLYDRELLESGDELKSGDLIEVEILIDSKNEYESLIIRDFKAAGMEPVETRSGYRYESGMSSYVEFRDAAVCFFVERLPQGRSKLTYRLRAETPGLFSALPTKIEAMYAPELKGNSDEFKAKIVD